jgi:hypothetical protein
LSDVIVTDPDSTGYKRVLEAICSALHAPESGRPLSIALLGQELATQCMYKKTSKHGKREWCANGSTDQSHLRMWHLVHTRRQANMENGNDAPMAAQTSLISGCDTFWEQARIMAMCALQVFNQTINQSMNISIPIWIVQSNILSLYYNFF